MMLLKTKLYPPPRQDALVVRTHLHRLLAKGRRHPLTLVSAPAGFGKTTLVSGWLHSQDAPFAWVSLDAADNDPMRFWAYVAAALDTAWPGLDPDVGTVTDAPHPPSLEVLVGTLINEVVDRGAVDEAPRVLVLDDYHAIRDERIHRSVNYLLDHLPAALRLVVVTRSDPPLRLARRLGRREMVEVRAADLRFSAVEARALLNDQMALGLVDADIEALTQRTEGWVASLQLAALSLQSHPDPSGFVAAFTGDNRYVVDYLVDEVFAQQPPAVQAFLIRTSILDRLAGPLCNAVVFGPDAGQQGVPAGQAVLRELERANLFLVPLDEQRQWFRYHHLFADMLRQRLRHAAGEDAAALHERASRWFEEAGDIEEAIRHAIHGEAWGRAARLLDGAVQAMWDRSHQATLCRLLDAFPEAMLQAEPNLCCWYAWALLLMGRPDEAEAPLSWAEAACHQQDDPAMLGRVANLRAVEARLRGDSRAMAAHARTALALLPEDKAFARGHSTLLLALGLLNAGRADEAWTSVQASRTLLRSVGNTFLRSVADSVAARILCLRGRPREALRLFYSPDEEAAWIRSLSTSYFVSRGAAHYELNQLDDAARYLDLARGSMRFSGREVYWSRCYVLLAQTAQARGDADQAADHLDRALELAEALGDAQHVAEAEALRVRLWLAHRDAAAAGRWVEARSFEETGPIPYERAAEHHALARVLVATGQHDALGVLDRLIEAAESDGRVLDAVRALVAKALALEEAGRESEAVAAVRSALGRSGTALRVFLDEGPRAARLLREAALRGEVSDRIAALLEAFEHEPAAPRLQTHPEPPRRADLFSEALSERELDVLRLIAEGKSNPEVAAELYVSLNTVKTHAKHINAKLNAHSRQEAVTRARVLNLL